MNLYEKHVYEELNAWHKDILKQAGMLEKASKGLAPDW